MDYEQRRQDAAWELNASDDTRIWEYTPRTAHSGQDKPPQSDFYVNLYRQDAQRAQEQADLMNSSGASGEADDEAQDDNGDDADRWSQMPL